MSSVSRYSEPWTRNRPLCDAGSELTDWQATAGPPPAESLPCGGTPISMRVPEGW